LIWAVTNFLHHGDGIKYQLLKKHRNRHSRKFGVLSVLTSVNISC